LTFLMAILSGATVLALRAIFEQQPIQGLGDDASESGITLFQSALATAIVAPLVFMAVRRIEGSGVVKSEERASS
jgi:hypothetical protein